MPKIELELPDELFQRLSQLAEEAELPLEKFATEILFQVLYSRLAKDSWAVLAVNESPASFSLSSQIIEVFGRISKARQGSLRLAPSSLSILWALATIPDCFDEVSKEISNPQHFATQAFASMTDDLDHWLSLEDLQKSDRAGWYSLDERKVFVDAFSAVSEETELTIPMLLEAIVNCPNCLGSIFLKRYR